MPHLPSPRSDLATVHVMGVGGTAMAALAGMLVDAGYRVTGSDRAVYPPMSDVLRNIGVTVMEGYEASNLAHRPDLVVVGNVIRKTYAEAEALLASDLAYCSFPEALGALFLADAHSLVVAGTHGKTTTTSILAWLLEAGGLHPGFLVGGVARNFDRTARRGAGTHFVVEGDEYDTAFFDKGPKFLHYRARTAIVTSVEFDHADIYADFDSYRASFVRLARSLPTDGLLLLRADDVGAASLADDSPCTVETFGPGAFWDGRTESVDPATGFATFTVLRRGVPLFTARSVLVGQHNLWNQVAAAAAAIHAGVAVEDLPSAFERFEGIKRRQEVIGEPFGVTLVDDFAHHPTAVKVTLAALRERFGGRRLWCVWEPRSATSRRNIFQADYARSFDDADQVVIARPFDQGGIPEAERFSSDLLVADLADRGVDALCLDSADAIAATVAARAMPQDVVAIFSNGGFGGLHGKLAELLRARAATP